jgi:hypothetical protein
LRAWRVRAASVVIEALCDKLAPDAHSRVCSAHAHETRMERAPLAQIARLANNAPPMSR